MAKIGIVYGTTEGVTATVCEKIKKVLGDDVAELYNIDGITKEDIEKYGYLIFAAPTYDIGELQEDWEECIDVLDQVDFSGKKVTFVGTGDAEGYPDTFVDAMGIIYERIKNRGADFVGAWPTDEYTFDGSKAIVDGKFLGLVIDEDNEADLTDDRIERWVNQLKPEFNL